MVGNGRPDREPGRKCLQGFLGGGEDLLVEVGAVGLGAVLVLVLHTALADVTGILAASSLAIVGLLIIPAKRRRAKADLQAKLETLREQLMKSMTEAFERELDRSVQRLREAIAPYTRFVRAEQQKLDRVEGDLAQISGELGQIRSQIGEL